MLWPSGGLLKGVTSMTDIEVGQIAHGLLQIHVDHDHRVTDMRSFYWALVQALQEAHVKSWKDRIEAESLVKH
jgi:hypothetical protein